MMTFGMSSFTVLFRSVLYWRFHRISVVLFPTNYNILGIIMFETLCGGANLLNSLAARLAIVQF